MTELLTAAQMRAIEKAAIESGEVTGLELMERAGRGVVEAVFAEWPELAKAPHRAVVLCGPGNNGGDGFVVARLLKEWGWEVEVFLYGDPDKLPPDARVNYERWGGMGEVSEIDPAGANACRAVFQDDTSIVIDAVFGTGLSRTIEGGLLELFFACHPDGDMELTRPETPKFVSVDIASGFCADSGKPLKAVLPSDLTVAFHRAKLGQFLDVAPHMTPSLCIADIGLGQWTDWDRRQNIKLCQGIVGKPFNSWGFDGAQGFNLDKHGEALQNFLDWPGNSHKYTHGHALVLSGPSGKTGAARLAARGALRIGAGLVTVGCPHDALTESAAQLTAIMLTEIGDADALAQVLGDDRINALCVGPGFGVDRAAAFLPQVLAAGRAKVLDADALTALSNDAALFKALHKDCVLTPHAGEFARLFPDIAEKLNAPATKGPAYSKVDATREAAARAGCVVLFKGPDTVIAAPDGQCAINAAVYDRAAPWLATAGAGDVLAGFITGLLARGFSPIQAAETAAWLHVECARSFGPGLIAEDLPEALPGVFRDLGL